MNIDTYAIRMLGGPGGANIPNIVGVRAQIFLFPDSGVDVNTISFYEPPHAIPDESENSHMHLPFACFDSVVDMLRNEQPIELFWLPLEGWSLQTKHERIGEGELK